MQVGDQVLWPKLNRLYPKRPARATIKAIDGDVAMVSYKSHGLRCVQWVPLAKLELA